VVEDRVAVGDLVKILREYVTADGHSTQIRRGIQHGIVIDRYPHRWPSTIEDEHALQILLTGSEKIEEWSELDVELISRI